ncbi:MAG TPA: FAD-dependent oxidoreductase [Puia sp.]|nr:FAD-dependent oxidoreductase [Puia sp.]
MSNRKFKRRSFIKNTIFGGLGASVIKMDSKQSEDHKSNPDSKLPDPTGNPRKTKKIIVGGAGIAGLCTAYELMKKGHDVVVLEASGRHGGHVYTAHDGLSDGLYGDFGQEHFTKPGYVKYWEYVAEFGLDALPYPRRKNPLRRIGGKFYSEAMLHDPVVLRAFGFNEKEVDYLSRNSWTDLELLYKAPYLDKFTDEYQPFNVGYDDWDNISLEAFFIKEGASKAALKFVGDANTSALASLWGTAILKMRGVPLWPTEIFRLKGGNQMLPNAFAKRLGERVVLDARIMSIKNGESGVTVSFKKHNEQKELSADYFVNCIPLPAFRHIPIEPAVSPERQYIFDNVTYDSYQRFVFQASSKFWLEDGLSINISFDSPDLWDVWQSADEVDSNRVIILGTGAGGISPQRALAAFRDMYPGKKDSIEQVISKDWTKDAYSSTCERKSFPIGTFKKFWPLLMKPEGRIHFAGAYADNLNWGTEAATRSANRVAAEIHEA